MTPRDKLAFLAAIILGAMGVEITAGVVWLAIIGREVPGVMASMAGALVPALIGLLAMPPSNVRHTNGTPTQPTTHTGNDLSPRG